MHYILIFLEIFFLFISGLICSLTQMYYFIIMFQFLTSCPKLSIYYHLKSLLSSYFSENAEHFVVFPTVFPEMYSTVEISKLRNVNIAIFTFYSKHKYSHDWIFTLGRELTEKLQIFLVSILFSSISFKAT